VVAMPQGECRAMELRLQAALGRLNADDAIGVWAARSRSELPGPPGLRLGIHRCAGPGGDDRPDGQCGHSYDSEPSTPSRRHGASP
jgi:hypothetical protein